MSAAIALDVTTIMTIGAFFGSYVSEGRLSDALWLTCAVSAAASFAVAVGDLVGAFL